MHVQDNILNDIKVDIGVIKQEQQSLGKIVEKLTASIEKITDNIRNDHIELMREYEQIKARLRVLEDNAKKDRENRATWVSPIFCSVVAASIINGVVLFIEHLH